MRSILHGGALIGICLLTVGTAVPARADLNADKAAISNRLYQWAEAFNTRDSAGTCDLFAPDLISTVPGSPDAGRDAVCARLAALLAKPDMQFHYSPDIQEIIVSGDIAVVRLIWTLTVDRGSEQQSSKETGIDIFQRQPDGTWSIIRFLAFSTDIEGS